MAVNTEKLEALRMQLEEIRKQIQEEAKAVFVQAVAALFAANEDLDSFGWQQWTDVNGATVEFIVNSEPNNIFINDSSVFEDRGEVSEEMSDSENRRAAYLAERVSEILIAVGESNLELMFGDDKEIVVYRNGDIEVEPFENHA